MNDPIQEALAKRGYKGHSVNYRDACVVRSSQAIFPVIWSNQRKKVANYGTVEAALRVITDLDKYAPSLPSPAQA
jgi:hypothetical protein